MTNKICLLSFFLCFSFFYGFSQDEDIPLFDFTNNKSSSFKNSIPITTGYCENLKGNSKKNKCFSDILQRDLKNNLEYPLQAIFDKKNGSAILDIHFGAYGTVEKCEIVEISDSLFASKAKASAFKISGYNAVEKKNKQGKCIIRTKIVFSYLEWSRLPQNKYEFYHSYFDENCTPLDSTQLLTCDSCKAKKFNKISKHKTAVLQHLESGLVAQGIDPTKISGHIFAKYSIDSKGNFIPCQHTFENTTSISTELLNEVISSIPNAGNNANKALEKSSLKTHKLILYFDERGLVNMLKKDNSPERMPIFSPDCIDVEDAHEQAKCSESKIMMHCQSNATYPAIALENGVSGRVFIEFVVDQTGYATDIKVIRGVHPSIDKSAINAVKTLPRFEPALQRGLPVKLKYTIPLNYRFR